MKKKILLISLVATMAISAVACAPTNNQNDESSQKVGTIEATTEAPTEAPAEAPTEAPTVANVVVGPGNYIEKGNLKISLESAKQYDEIKNGDDDIFTAEPKDGKKYLVLFFEAENISSEDQYINTFYHNAYLDDYDIDQTMLIVEPEGYSMFSGDLAAGKKLKGYVAYEVDPDWKKLEFTYTDGISSSSDTYEFVVTPDDLT